MRRWTSPLRSPRQDPELRAVRAAAMQRDEGCVGSLVGFPTVCFGTLEMDHVRASGALGKKSVTAIGNCVMLCGRCHRWKTEHGREARPLLLAYLEGQP